MQGRKGLFSLFTSLPDHAPEPEAEKSGDVIRRRRRRHSSGDRETWSRKVEYFFAGLGYAVGLGNIWRFPYLCYRNGGGAFLIPYTIALILVGFPMMFMELGFGQFASLGPITIWRISPLFKGIGYAIVVVIFLVNSYYNVLIAYSLFFMFASITNELPWANCDNKWNTKYCIKSKVVAISEENSTLMRYVITTPKQNLSIDSHLLKTPTEEFFERHLLHMSSGIDTLGDVQWPLIVCLFVSWGVCYICLHKGIKSMGKAVILTSIFSYAILTVLFIRGVTLPGAYQGIIYYLKPDFKQLGKLQVWGEASAQAFASLSLGGGGWITLASYNKFKNRFDRDVLLVGIGNALTSFYAGFVIFSVLGYMAYMKGVDVSTVTKTGPGLAFVAYPEGLALIPGAPFWAICFFFMMFTVGLDSLFGQVETITAGIVDEYPDYLRPHRKLFTMFICACMFFMGIPLVTEGGMYLVTLLDWYTLLFSFSIISLFQVFAIIYVYGYTRFAADIQMMLGKRPSIFYRITWLVVTPIVLMCVIALLAKYYVPAFYGDYQFPDYAKSIGWAFALGPVGLIPLTMVAQFIRRLFKLQNPLEFFTDAGSRREVIQSLLSPTTSWGPALPENFRKYSTDHYVHGAAELSGAAIGDDDVFGGGVGEEMSELRPPVVHFEDDKCDVGGAGDMGDRKGNKVQSAPLMPSGGGGDSAGVGRD